VTGRRRAILDAALACFQERGFAATSMEEIRARSRASVGSIYHHFEGKEQLAEALYLDGLAEYQAGLLARVEKHKDAERGIRQVVLHHLDWVENKPALAGYMLAQQPNERASSRRAEMRAQRQAFFQRVSAWLAPHRASGAIKPLPDHLVVAIVFGPCQEYGRYWLTHRGEKDMRTARRLLADAAWNAVRGEAHGARSRS
jgi:AcrR family transcriptional regulator